MGGQWGDRRGGVSSCRTEPRVTYAANSCFTTAPAPSSPGRTFPLALSDRPGAAPVARRWHPAARGSAWLMRGKPLTSPSGSAVRDPNCRVPSANHAARLWRLRLERRLILPEHTSPSDMLSDWRAAERDTVASHTASKVAQLALAAATAAEAAALEVDTAATAAVEALERARSAATQARKAATQAAEAAQLAFATAEGAVVRADAVEERAHVAEDAARERYQQTETKRFPKD